MNQIGADVVVADVVVDADVAIADVVDVGLVEAGLNCLQMLWLLITSNLSGTVLIRNIILTKNVMTNEGHLIQT